MTTSRRLARHRYSVQVFFVIVTTAGCVLIADALAFRPPANLAWIMGLPVVVGVLANVGWDRRCFMALALLGLSFIVAMIVGVHFTSYG